MGFFEARIRRASVAWSLVALLSAGCGSGDDATDSESGGTTSAQTATTATGAGGQGHTSTSSTTSTSTTSGAGGAGAGGGDGGAPPQGLTSLGALVVLGDSISDGGGQSPFYYDMLKNDLGSKYGNIAYHNKAQSGSKTGALVGQIDDLPGTLPGPVAVVITSGGNDMKAALLQIVTGTDGPAKAQMEANVAAALDTLTTPGRFGAGVEVHVFEGNIYDASDGKGDFGSHGCAFGQGMPTIATDPFFDAWNGVIATEIAGHGQVAADMHAHFYGHGYAGSPDWFASDCTHPNALGHDQLRRLFYSKITGEMLP